jgi:catechol 2,3-dioxygenase-like lactoylglutathione lyase family enzyme
MGFHHVALAVADLAATHGFYTRAMGFGLAKVVVNPTPEGGWAKHAFYRPTRRDGTASSEAGMIAFWELHGDYRVPAGGMSGAVGLPDWVNHLAFHAEDPDHLDTCLARWQELGLDVMDIDHGFCRSIYTSDPDGTLVEWCLDTRALDADDAARAAEAILAADPPHDPPPVDVVFHPGDPARRPDWAAVAVPSA